MPLSKRLVLAILFAVVALAASGRVSVYQGKSSVLMSHMLWRAPLTAAVELHRCGSQVVSDPSQWRKSLQRKSGFLPASLVPIQFKDPRGLGAGKLLVARRDLSDPDFAETVVLLVHYDEKGVLGLVLNRRTDLPLSRVFDLKAAKDLSAPVYLGGPVETSSVFALLRSSSKIEKAENIFGGVYLISDKDLFEKTLSARPDSGVFHVYLGYAGWTQDQLRAEVQSGSWFIFPADAAAVFNSDPNSLWLQMIQKTEFKWAKTEPFAIILQPAQLIW